jgi:hypothetical protein
MSNKVTAAKVRQANSGTKASQGNGAKGKVRLGKKLLKRLDPDAKPGGKSDQMRKFKSNQELRRFIEDQLRAGKVLKEVGDALGVTGARIHELLAQLSMTNWRELKQAATAEVKAASLRR